MSKTHMLISARAYEIWEGEGRPAGRAGSHWLQAEREMLEALAKPVAEKVAKPKRASRKRTAPRRAGKAA